MRLLKFESVSETTRFPKARCSTVDMASISFVATLHHVLLYKILNLFKIYTHIKSTNNDEATCNISCSHPGSFALFWYARISTNPIGFVLYIAQVNDSCSPNTYSCKMHVKAVEETGNIRAQCWR